MIAVDLMMVCLILTSVAFGGLGLWVGGWFSVIGFVCWFCDLILFDC